MLYIITPSLSEVRKIATLYGLICPGFRIKWIRESYDLYGLTISKNDVIIFGRQIDPERRKQFKNELAIRRVYDTTR